MIRPTDDMIDIGVIGAGHLGKFHIECLSRIPSFRFVGFYDSDPKRSSEVADQYNITAFPTCDDLLDACDAVCIVTPTITHFDIASKAIRHGKHVFVEKPLTDHPSTSSELSDIITSTELIGRVGHVERYNPAFQAAKKYGLHKPVFIEAHRLAPFNIRGMDVPVVMDLMIHDIDIILSVIDDEIDHIEANGVGVAGKSADICNARITFKNKAVANLTASRISMKQMRKLRLFQRDQYMAIDFLNREVQIVKLLHTEPKDLFSMKMDLPDGERWIAADHPEIEKNNAIEEELSDFLAAIRGEKTAGVTFAEGAKAVKVAHQIMDQIMKYEV